MSSLDFFRLKFEKVIVMFEISILEFSRIEFLGNTVDFGIGPVFSKGPGSSVFGDPGPGKGRVYKVCQLE